MALRAILCARGRQEVCIPICSSLLNEMITSKWHSPNMKYCSHWSRHTPEGAALEVDWNAKFAAYEKKYPEDAATLKSIITGELPADWVDALPVSVHICLRYKADLWMMRL
jgi:hypothetical protein